LLDVVGSSFGTGGSESPAACCTVLRSSSGQAAAGVVKSVADAVVDTAVVATASVVVEVGTSVVAVPPDDAAPDATAETIELDGARVPATPACSDDDEHADNHSADADSAATTPLPRRTLVDIIAASLHRALLLRCPLASPQSMPHRCGMDHRRAR
jgi:hypothetical protein